MEQLVVKACGKLNRPFSHKRVGAGHKTKSILYSRKYWQSLKLAVWSKTSVKNIGRL